MFFESIALKETWSGQELMEVMTMSEQKQLQWTRILIFTLVATLDQLAIHKDKQIFLWSKSMRQEFNNGQSFLDLALSTN